MGYGGVELPRIASGRGFEDTATKLIAAIFEPPLLPDSIQATGYPYKTHQPNPASSAQQHAVVYSQLILIGRRV